LAVVVIQQGSLAAGKDFSRIHMRRILTDTPQWAAMALNPKKGLFRGSEQRIYFNHPMWLFHELSNRHLTFLSLSAMVGARDLGFSLGPPPPGNTWSWLKHGYPIDSEGFGELLCPEVEKLSGFRCGGRKITF